MILVKRKRRGPGCRENREELGGRDKKIFETVKFVKGWMNLRQKKEKEKNKRENI